MEQQYQNTPQAFEEDSLDLRKYFYLIRANWYWFIPSLFLALAIAFMVNRYTMPTYNVRASLLLNEGSSAKGLSGYENVIPGMEIYGQRRYAVNEMEILKSYSLAYKTVQQLDFGISYAGIGRSGLKEVVMYNNCPFYVEMDSSKNNLYGYSVEIRPVSETEYEVFVDDQYEIRETLKYGEAFNSIPFNFTIQLKNPENFLGGYGKYSFKFNSPNSLANIYKNKLTISSNDERRGGVLYLSLTDFNTHQATDYLNKLMEVYINQGLEEKNQTATNTVEFIDTQLSIIDDSLQIAEENIQNFRLSNSVIDLTSEGNLIYSKLDKYENEKANLELNSRYYSYLLSYVNSKIKPNEILAPASMGISDFFLNNLINQLNTEIIEKKSIAYSANNNNSQVEISDAKIINLKNALIENIEGLIENNNRFISQVQIDIKNTEKELRSLPITERQLISIQRKYKVNDQIYTYLLEKRAEAAVAKASNVADNKILDYARYESATKISPNTKTNYMFGLFGGIGIPFILLILLELSNSKITSSNDIEKKVNIPIIAHIGHSAKGDVPVFEAPSSSLAESFRGLRTNLQYLLREKDQKVISITSTISGEGKTFISINLAAIFALSGKKTLIVGLDLRRPKLHRIFNIGNETGLSAYLIGKASYEEILKETQVDGLFMIPSGPNPPNPAELLDTPAMLNFLEKARKDFDIIILDTPPFGVVTDALLVGRHSDTNLFIVRQNYTERDALELMNEIRKQQNLKNLGIVFNDLKLTGYYQYGYKYYNYSYAYRYGYTYGSDYYGKE